MSTWFKLHRDVMDHWISEDPVKFKRWLYMLAEVNFKESKVLVGNTLHSIPAGSSAYSIRTWADKFGCGTKSTVNFFNLLESDDMIIRKTIGKGKHSTTLVVIENYEKYQGEGQREGGSKRPRKQPRKGSSKGHTEEEGKEGEELKEGNNNPTLFKDFEDPEKEKLYKSWLEYRVDIKKPIKAKATIEKLIAKINLETLEKCKAVINQTIESGWQGLFWDKHDANGTKKNNSGNSQGNGPAITAHRTDQTDYSDY